MSHTPRKRFGQHFLQDDFIIRNMLEAIMPLSSDHLVEIGPGQGALTFPVLAQSRKMDVIELDRDLIPILMHRAKQKGGELIIHEQDALGFDFSQLREGEKKLRVIGNLPYNISTPLIFHLLSYAEHIQDMHFMLQKEVVDRLAAETNGDAYGRLSIMVQYHCTVTALFDVPPEAFDPPPKVNSSVVRLVPHSTLPFVANDFSQFHNLVRQAFNQRRKTLRNALKPFFSNEDWGKIAIDPSKRPEELSLKEFVYLSNQIS